MNRTEGEQVFTQIGHLGNKVEQIKTAIGNVETFHETLTSLKYPDNLPPKFPKSLDIRPSVDDHEEFTGKIARIDYITSIRVPGSLALLKTKKAGLTESLNYARKLLQHESRLQTGSMTQEQYKLSEEAFSKILVYVNKPFNQRREIVYSNQKTEAVKPQLKYEVKNDGSIRFTNGRKIKGKQAEFFSAISSHLPEGISLDQLTVDFYGENTPENRRCAQTIITNLRKAVDNVGIAIPSNAPLKERRRRVKAHYTMEGLEMQNNINEQKPESNKKERKPLPHLDEEKINTLRFIIENPLAQTSEILDRMGTTQKGKQYRTHTAAYVLKGCTGLLFYWASKRDLNQSELELYGIVRKFMQANHLNSKVDFQSWLGKRLRA